MAKAARKKTPAVAPMIEFSRSRDIPFNRIHLSDSNVREIDVEDGLDELIHDIDRREDIVQGLNVRAVLDAEGAETGDFETPAGGRRYRAIARLVQAGRFPADGLVPCLVKKANAKTSAVDDSYAENVIRLALLGHVSRLSFDRKNKRMVCLFQAARSAYPKSWRRAAWNKHLRGGCGIVPLAIGGDESVTRTPLGLSARLSAPHI